MALYSALVIAGGVGILTIQDGTIGGTILDLDGREIQPGIKV